MEVSKEALRAQRLKYFYKKMHGDDDETQATDAKEVVANPEKATATLKEVADEPTFLTLPAEIRNMIYEYVLGGLILIPWFFSVSRYKMLPESSSDGGDKSLLSGEGWDKHTAVLRVNKQIYNEARLLPYSKNVFNTEMCSVFNRWLDATQKYKREAITAVFVNEYDYHLLFRWIENCWVRLENLQIIFCKIEASDSKKRLIEEYVAVRNRVKREEGKKGVRIVYCKLDTKVWNSYLPVA